MADERCVKVFHAARQDLEIVWNLGELVPAPLFDTQVAAMVCGYGDSVSYEQLVNDLTKAQIDKSSRFTDWSRRPLTEAQLTYALSDVTHLRDVYEALLAAAREERPPGLARRGDGGPHLARDLSGRSRERLAAARRPAAQAARARGPDGDRRLARARGAEPRRAARPRAEGRRALRDRRLRAAHASRRSAGCARSRTASSARAPAADILAAVERGLARDPDHGAGRPSGHAAGGAAGAVVELLKVLLKAVAEQEGVAPKIIATVDDLEAIAEDDRADVPVPARLAARALRRQGAGAEARRARPGACAGAGSSSARRLGETTTPTAGLAALQRPPRPGSTLGADPLTISISRLPAFVRAYPRAVASRSSSLLVGRARPMGAVGEAAATSSFATAASTTIGVRGSTPSIATETG